MCLIQWLAHNLLDTEPLQGANEGRSSEIVFLSMISEEEREELKTELVKLEEEVSTLRQVLSAKEKHRLEIKQKLGMTLMDELRQNLSKGWHDVQTTSAYKKTHETLSQAGLKATAALNNMGMAISRKFGDMRNSPTFKSFEERVETTVTSLKMKVGGAGGSSGGSFEEVLSSTAQASSLSSAPSARFPEQRASVLDQEPTGQWTPFQQPTSDPLLVADTPFGYKRGGWYSPPGGS
ncbi:tumor protein D53 isoform X1 [Ornithorhynchus anatinus]|uniref:tumor protein D53 isoform X1 n=1 Tax=Ornithorhynchus anatinus TaxID=9258 RepID=UPI0010A8C36A|nr:tumor protein D53 isoform X1 [Ornithorhynchus anatinus]